MIKRLALVLFGLPLLAALLVFVVASVYVHREGRLYRFWEEELFDGRGPAERYPAREANETARAIEALAAEIGIDFSTVDRADPAPELGAAEGWELANEPVRRHLAAVVSSADAAIPASPPEVTELLASRQVPLSRVRDLLLTGEPPRWELDLELAFHAPLPDYLAQLRLHRLLLVAALEAERGGDPGAAGALLEAAWRLGQGAAADPKLLGRLVRYSELGGELAVARRLCAPGADWPARLAAVELRSGALVSLQLDGWMIHHAIRTGRMVEVEELANFEWFQRLLFFPYGESMQHAVERLRRQDPLTFDNERFSREQLERIPRWSLPSRMLLPNLFDVWHKAVRAELAAEHTARILAARELLTRGESPADGRQPSAAVPALSWVTESGPREIRIRLDGDLVTATKQPVALDYRLPRAGCPRPL